MFGRGVPSALALNCKTLFHHDFGWSGINNQYSWFPQRTKHTKTFVTKINLDSVVEWVNGLRRRAEDEIGGNVYARGVDHECVRGDTCLVKNYQITTCK